MVGPASDHRQARAVTVDRRTARGLAWLLALTLVATWLPAAPVSTLAATGAPESGWTAVAGEAVPAGQSAASGPGLTGSTAPAPEPMSAQDAMLETAGSVKE